MSRPIIAPPRNASFSKIRFKVVLARAALLALLALLPAFAAQASEIPESCFVVDDVCYIIGNTCFNDGADCGDGSTWDSEYKWKAGWCQVAIQFGVISGTVYQCVDGSARTLYERVLVSSLDPSISVVRAQVAFGPPQQAQGNNQRGSNQQGQSQRGNQQSSSGNGGNGQSGAPGNNPQQNQQNQQNDVVVTQTLTLNLPQQERQGQNQNQQQGQYQQQNNNQPQGQYQQQQGRSLADRKANYQHDMNSLACGDTLDLTGMNVQRCGTDQNGVYSCETITSYTKRCSC